MSSVHHDHPKVTIPLKSAREYLAALEAVARHGRTSDNPAEVAAALQSFTRPSAVLLGLAAESRSAQS